MTIPWECIKPEYKWAAKDDDGHIYVYTEKPKAGAGAYQWSCREGVYHSVMAMFGVDAGSVMWNDSLTQRPE